MRTEIKVACTAAKSLKGFKREKDIVLEEKKFVEEPSSKKT
jgi:hypothetical protein